MNFGLVVNSDDWKSYIVHKIKLIIILINVKNKILNYLKF